MKQTPKNKLQVEESADMGLLYLDLADFPPYNNKDPTQESPLPLSYTLRSWYLQAL